MQRYIKYILGIMLLGVVFVAGCGTQTANTTDEKSSNILTVSFLNVGQGDAVLVDTGSQKVLFDTSDVDERENLQRELNKLQVKTLNKVILTHPHADHIGGMGLLLKNYEVEAVCDNGMPSTSPVYRSYMKELKSQKIPRKGLKAGDKLDLGNGVTFVVFNPSAETVNKGQAKGYKHNPNNESVVGKLIYKDFSLLITGDVEKDMESELVKSYYDNLHARVLKSPHHGSKTSSSQKFLDEVDPETVIISLGKKNEYGHPHDVTLQRYEKMGLDVYRTDVNGTITITTDGKAYSVKGEKS